MERRPAVHGTLTHSGRCRPLLEGQVRQVLCAGALQSRYTDGLDCAAVSACTSRHERLQRRSFLLRPRSSRTLHACTTLELEVERASTALVSVPHCSREESKATHHACVGLTAPSRSLLPLLEVSSLAHGIPVMRHSRTHGSSSYSAVILERRGGANASQDRSAHRGLCSRGGARQEDVTGRCRAQSCVPMG